MLLGSGFPISGASFTQIEQVIEQLEVNFCKHPLQNYVGTHI
jgi:hypothetical protein